MIDWFLVGWVMIGVSAVSLLLLTLFFRSRKGYAARRLAAVDAFRTSQSVSIEQGRLRQILLGDQLWTSAYPGLGLHALTILPKLLDVESAVDGGLSLSAGEGSLAVFARQIIEGRYTDGFSTALSSSGVRSMMPGVTPLSLTAGMLSELSAHPHGSLGLLGHLSPSVLLLAETVHHQKGHVFGAGGSLSAQAVLFPVLQDLLLGETVYMLPGLIDPDAGHQAGWLTEDILRFLLICGLIVGAVLKMIGVL